MKSFLTFLFLCLSSGIFGQTTQRFANIQLTATPTEAVAASVTNFLQLDGTGIGEKVSPTTLWSAVVLTGTADSTDLADRTTVGGSFFTLVNPSAVTFPRINANNTVTAQTSANLKIDLKIRDFFVDDYIVAVDDGLDDKAGIQACIDAAEAAGGGTVWLGEGIYEIHPLGTSLGLLVNGDKICFRGKGKTSILRIISTTSSAVFEGIASEGYNTTTTAFGASGLWLEDFKIECDAYSYATVANRNAHGLIGICHAPWAIVRNVTFGSICYHQLEVNKSRNVVVEGCDFTGNTESSRWQIDVASSAGAISTTPTNFVNENLLFSRCRLAGRDITGQTLGVPRMIELSHSSLQENKNIVIEKCEIGAVYNTTSYTAGYGIVFETAPRRSELLQIRDNCFLGQTHGEAVAIDISAGAGTLQGCLVENNYFGSGVDCDGTRHAGGFLICIKAGENFGGYAHLGATISTNYSTRQGIVVRNNVMEPRWVLGTAAVGYGVVNTHILNVGPAADAVVAGNVITFPVFDSTFTAASNDIITMTGSGTTAGMRQGDPIRVTTSAADLPLNLVINTTYYVREILSATTFTISATSGGAVFDIADAGTGTHTWSNYLASVALGYNVGYGINEVQNLKFENNTCLWQHSATVSAGDCYSASISAVAMEVAAVPSWYAVTNNRFSEIGAGTVTYGLVEFAAAQVAAPVVRGDWVGNTHTGTFTNADVTQGHNFWRGVPTTPATLGAGATTLAVTGRVAIVTGDGGGNTLSTITRVGTRLDDLLVLKFTDALVTITDTDAATANTVDLSAAFTSSARDTLTLAWDGTKWIEAFRSVN